MKMRRPFTLALAILAILLTIVPAMAAPQLPAAYFGTVTVNGTNVAEGTEITVWHNGTQYAQSTTTMSEGLSGYNVQVNVDDPETSEQEGVAAGTTVTFKIGSLDAEQNIAVQPGASETLNLTATGSEPPTPTPTPTPPPSGSVIDDDSGQATFSFAGTRTIEMEDILFSEINANGEDFIATVATADQQPWLATHTAANSGGWHVVLSAASDFSDGAGHSIALDAGDSLNGFTVGLPDDNVTGRSGSNSKPLSQALTKQIVSTTGISVLSAATGTGEGIYDFIPQFELFIPGTTIGANYSTTVEVKMVFGP
ncbi:MAG: hypothetical protein ACPGWR_02540 [Ardenticatenaceae bacterium]